VSDWLSFRTAVVAAIEAAMPPAVLETTGVAWEDGPRPHTGTRLLLSVVSATFDDRDSALSEGGTQRLESMVVIAVQVRSESTYDSGDIDALWLIEQVRLGLRKVSVREALKAAGIVIQIFPRSTRNIGGMADDRALSVHAFDFTCCTSFFLSTTEDAGLIEHIEAGGTLTDVDASTFTVTLPVDDPNPEP
jgi:hypothetical protein